MSKTTLDSDLYGDIYGDDEVYGTNDNDDEPEIQDSTIASGQAEMTADAGESTSNDVSSSSLPLKPSNYDSHSLSYSAQVAQQFSQYHQTPSQERQQRSAIPTHTSDDNNGRVIQNAIQVVQDSSSDTVYGKKPSEMHDDGKLFIGGLNWDTTDEGLKNYFSQFGKVDACTIMRDPSGTSRGFAFLTFEDPSSVENVIGKDHNLDGKAIDPKRAIPREEHLRNTRYFLGGLSPATTSESLKAFFSPYGKVVDATVMIDRESGRSKGFGFVTFEDAAEVVIGKGLVVDDKEIEVKLAQPRSQREQQARSGSAQGMREAFYNPGSTNNQVVRPFIGQQQPMMFAQQQQQQRPMMMPMMMGMGGMGAMGAMGMGGMGMMNGMNPMMGMGGMGMMNGMNMGGMGAMGMGAGMGNMGNMAGMRLGMNPIGAGGMMNMGVGMMRGGAMPGGGRTQVGPGPARTTRGQHAFHPYAR